MSKPSSLFDRVPAYAGDPILSLMQLFQADARPHKASLGIGLYFDDAGRIPVLDCVRQATAAVAGEERPSSYLPMEGLPAYRQAVQALVFGAGHEAVLSGRIATLQSPGGSGALKVGADFLRQHGTGGQVWVSDPTWDNHVALFEGAGFEVGRYPYYDEATGGIRVQAMIDTFRCLPAGTVVLLHASCHNPTGVDLTHADWQAVIDVVAERGLVPFVDMAYQGFGDGLDEDAWAVRTLASQGIEFLVANSFSKNFSLYGERVGGLSVVCASQDAAQRVLGQLQAAVRRNYSSPPAYGARIVEHVLCSPQLLALWQQELGAMRERMLQMRRGLHSALNSRLGTQGAFDFLLRQRGMFSYTGLNPAQVERLREVHGVYLVASGRLCVSGLRTDNLQHVAAAIADVLEREAAEIA
jgi:aromatic-amino-acid transaminase